MAKKAMMKKMPPMKGKMPMKKGAAKTDKMPGKGGKGPLMKRLEGKEL